MKITMARRTVMSAAREPMMTPTMSIPGELSFGCSAGSSPPVSEKKYFNV